MHWEFIKLPNHTTPVSFVKFVWNGSSLAVCLSSNVLIHFDSTGVNLLCGRTLFYQREWTSRRCRRVNSLRTTIGEGNEKVEEQARERKPKSSFIEVTIKKQSFISRRRYTLLSDEGCRCCTLITYDLIQCYERYVGKTEGKRNDAPSTDEYAYNARGSSVKGMRYVNDARSNDIDLRFDRISRVKQGSPTRSPALNRRRTESSAR